MVWNWQLAEWPKFTYDFDRIAQQEKQFLLNVGRSFGFLKHINDSDYKQFVVEILSAEGFESSKIEGELLNRESLQSSIKRHFGIQAPENKQAKKEAQMAEILCEIYESFLEPLSHEMLWHWHAILFNDQFHIDDRGTYRTHSEPMQIVSNRTDLQRIFFEAPPSSQIPNEMNQFINEFNSKNNSVPILGQAAITHVYFESIHPFEDGNGRIGRVLVEKVLSQSIGKPTLIAASKVLEKRKKDYYAALEQCNRTLEISHFVEFFADSILQAQKESMDLLHFLIEKSKMMTALSGQLNDRQEKVLLRMFSEGPAGFQGGLSAEKYITLTKTSKATATRDLGDLVHMKALRKTGELRHTRYWLNID